MELLKIRDAEDVLVSADDSVGEVMAIVRTFQRILIYSFCDRLEAVSPLRALVRTSPSEMTDCRESSRRFRQLRHDSLHLRMRWNTKIVLDEILAGFSKIESVGFFWGSVTKKSSAFVQSQVD